MDLFTEHALKFLNIPYLYGGNSPASGLDCSGLALCLIKAFGVPIKGDTNAQGLYMYCRNNNFEKVYRTGSLAFFGRDDRSISHVGILLNKEIMIEAGGGDATTTNFQMAVKQNACVRLRPIKNRIDLVSVYFPNYRVSL